MNKLLLLVLMALSSSCVSRAQENVLLPAMRTAWTGIYEDIQRGIDDVSEGDNVNLIDIVFLASTMNDLVTSDQPFAHMPWESAILPIAARGIEARVASGEMHTLVAESLRERLRKFTEAFAMLDSQPLVYSQSRSTWLSDGTQITNGMSVSLSGKATPLTYSLN